MDIINSRTNKIVSNLKKLSNKKYRKQNNECLIEGEKLIVEAINSKIKIKAVIIEEGKKFNFKFNGLIYYVSSSVMKYLSDTITPQGIMAVIDTNYQYNSNSSKFLVLDNLQNPDNFGAIIRTAVATGFNKIYAINCVDAFNSKVLRSCMGTIFRCEIIESNYQQIKELSKNNNIYYADMRGENIFNVNSFSNNLGLVIGNEGRGISEEIKQITSKTLSIPMLNNVESLNASVSAGILMYELINKMK